MKKTIRLFTTLMVCMAMALCVSCKKDDDKSNGGGGGNTGGGGGGSQTVEMRISKVSGNVVYYYEGSTDGGQTWNVINEGSYQGNTIYTWNDNLLSSVKRYSDDCGYDFRYDNDKLSNVIWTDVNDDGRIDTVGYYYDIEYDGDNMSEVTFHEEDHGFDRVYHLEYSNGKLSSVTSVDVTSVEISNVERNIDVNYFWNGDNISEIRRISGSYSHDVSLSYDDKKNPLYGIDALLVMNIEDYALSLSKNNYTKFEEVISRDQLVTQLVTETIDYTYNGENYPTQAVCNRTVSQDYNPQYPQYELFRERVVFTTTYEYLD